MLRNALKELGWLELPEQWEETMLEDDENAKNLYDILVNREISEGKVKWNSWEKEYTIHKGIVDMELDEDDV